MDATHPDSGQPNSTRGQYYVILFPPDKMTAVERRVADVIRHDLRLREDPPPGIYLVAEEGSDSGPRIVVKHGQHPDAGGTVPESTTAVGSSFSTMSKSTLGNPSPSNVSIQVTQGAGTATKIFESEPRVEVPPEVLGDYFSVTYTDKDIENMAYVQDKASMYRLQITIYPQGHKMAFELQADTGANNAWLFHRNTCLLVAIQDNPGSAGVGASNTLTLRAGTERPKARPALPLNYMPSYLAKKMEAAGTPAGENFTHTSSFRYPCIKYSSEKSTLVVGPMRSPIDFEIKNAYQWLTSGSDKKDTLKARASFAVCDAAATDVFEDLRMDGLIGFGPEVNMNVFNPPFRHEEDYGNRDYPSFSTALQDFLPRVDEEGGIVLYWYLKPPVPHNERTGSFLAFNEFPEHLLCHKITWTPPILVENLPNRRSAGHRAWVITVKKLKVHLVADKEYKERHGYEDDDILIDFGRNGEKFCVDTGHGTTLLPPNAISALEFVFDSQSGRPYSAPEWVDLRASTVEFTFASGPQSMLPAQDIVFVTQAHHFLWDEHRHGLTWSSPWDESSGNVRCILGLNFFHSAVVAMHRPDPEVGEPYLRFAPMAERATDAMA